MIVECEDQQKIDLGLLLSMNPTYMFLLLEINHLYYLSHQEKIAYHNQIIINLHLIHNHIILHFYQIHI